MISPNFPPILNVLSLKNAAAAGNLFLPANAVVREVIVRNTTANAITGGLKFGTTSGGTDVAAALAVGANSIALLTDALLLKRSFTQAATQQIFFDAVVAWNNASVTIDVIYWQLS